MRNTRVLTEVSKDPQKSCMECMADIAPGTCRRWSHSILFYLREHLHTVGIREPEYGRSLFQITRFLLMAVLALLVNIVLRMTKAFSLTRSWIWIAKTWFYKRSEDNNSDYVLQSEPEDCVVRDGDADSREGNSGGWHSSEPLHSDTGRGESRTRRGAISSRTGVSRRTCGNVLYTQSERDNVRMSPQPIFETELAASTGVFSGWRSDRSIGPN